MACIYPRVSFRRDLDVARQSMGFCPQFNILYDNLTVSEHILFYGQLKGLSRVEAQAELESMLQATGMTPKAHALTKNLSGLSMRLRFL